MSETNCLAPLGVVARFHTGWTPPTTDSRNFNGGLAWANISDIASQKVMSTAKAISEKALREQPNARLAHPGDVLFPFKLSLGASGIAGIPMYTNEAIATFPVADNPNFEPRYLYYVLPVFVPRNAAINIYGAPLLSSERIRSARIPMPSLQRQRAVADYLDRETTEIDGMRADLDEMERLLTERRSAVIERLLLGESTPDLENLPRGWKKTTVGALFSLHNGDRGINYPSPEEIMETGIPFINAGDLASGSINLETCKRISADKYAAMGGAKLQRNDLLFCLRGSLGKWGLVDFDGGALASSLCALRLERLDLADVKYIAHTMSTRVFALQIWLSESGSAQPNLGAEQVGRFRIPLPPLAEQRRIADEIDRETAEIDSMLSDITKLRDLLAERRIALISAAVTGQIDIPVSPTDKDEVHA